MCHTRDKFNKKITHLLIKHSPQQCLPRVKLMTWFQCICIEVKYIQVSANATAFVLESFMLSFCRENISDRKIKTLNLNGRVAVQVY